MKMNGKVSLGSGTPMAEAGPRKIPRPPHAYLYRSAIFTEAPAVRATSTQTWTQKVYTEFLTGSGRAELHEIVDLVKHSTIRIGLGHHVVGYPSPLEDLLGSTRHPFQDRHAAPWDG